MLIANFFRERPRERMILAVAAGMLGTVAIGATFYSLHEIVATRDAEAAHRLAIKEGLGSFVAEGDDLMARCLDATKPVP